MRGDYPARHTGLSAFYFGSQSIGTRPVRWAANGKVTQLGILTTSNEGYTTGEAIGINNAGVIAANVTKYVANGNYTNHAVRYAPNSTVAVDLGTLGVDQNGTSTSHAESISKNGLIVGQATAYVSGQAYGTRPVYWTTSGSTDAIPLQTFGLSSQGYTSGGANSANADGVIAGWCSRYVNGLYFRDDAVLWNVGPNQIAIDLNTLLPANSPWVLTGASKISDTGFVSGYGSFTPTGGSPFQRAFSILVPQAGTYGKGDGNFDTKVNFDDLVLLAQHYDQTNAGQNIHVGDFNLDGVVNFGDLVALAQNYGLNDGGISTGFSTEFRADWALAQSLVPEPTSLAALALLPLLRRPPVRR